MKTARPLKAIRLKCLDCSGWNSKEVELCAHEACILFPLRFGKKPKGLKYTTVTMKEYERSLREF